MKSDPDPSSTSLADTADIRPYVGKFVRRQGTYGSILVVGLGGSSVELLENAKRLFPKDGLVETHGVAHAGLMPGDWAEFEIVRNSRPRAPQYKTAHLRRLPRYAVLPELTLSGYRELLTKTGWHGDRRSGLWALRISSDRVIVVQLASGTDGRLRIPRKATREVHWCTYRADLIASIPTETGSEDVFLGDVSTSPGLFDWSDEADHVAQVIRALADANDPRVVDLITWLELHHEEGTGRVFAAAVDHDAAEAALRSGELADRLRADRDLMKAYLDAALQDDQVREAVAAWAREGHSEEAERLRSELFREIDGKRREAEAQIVSEMEIRRTGELAKVETESAQLAETRRAQMDADLKAGYADRLLAIESELNRHREEGEREAAALATELEAAQVATNAARQQLDQIGEEEAEARARLAAISSEIDRLLAISSRLDLQERKSAAVAQAAGSGVGHVFQDRPHATAAKKGILIGRQVLLTDHGKQLMLQFATLMLAGELPLLTGGEAQSLVKVAEALLCPGRSASIEADPTIISVDDLWSRPGSGAPTALAAAAKAAESGGGALVIIRGIERSGARIWHPALADALRNGSLPRGLLVACVVGDAAHEEIELLARCAHVIHVEGALTESAYLAGPTLLSPPALELETLAPDEGRNDLSAANALLITLGFKPPLDLSLRIARIYLEAVALLRDETAAESIVDAIVRRMAEWASLRAPK